MSTLFTATQVSRRPLRRWSWSALFRALSLARSEIRRIDREAERERLQLGYARVPQRVWERRSALFIER